MRLSKMIAAGAIIAGLSMTSAMADYNKGFRYYDKYIKKKAKLTSTKMLAVLNVADADALKALFKDNAKPLVEKLKAAGKTKAAAAVEKVIKKGKLKDIEDFLLGIQAGRIPAGC